MKHWLAHWQFYALSSAFFAALTAVFGKIGVAGVNSDLATFLRTLVIVVIAGLFVFLRGEWQNPMQLSAPTLTFLFLSACCTGLSWLCYYHALQMTDASKVAPLDKLSVVMVLVLAVIFLHEVPSAKVCAGAALITAGAVLIAL